MNGRHDHTTAVCVSLQLERRDFVTRVVISEGRDFVTPVVISGRDFVTLDVISEGRDFVTLVVISELIFDETLRTGTT